jgi:hypothetical protein
VSGALLRGVPSKSTFQAVASDDPNLSVLDIDIVRAADLNAFIGREA